MMMLPETVRRWVASSLDEARRCSGESEAKRETERAWSWFSRYVSACALFFGSANCCANSARRLNSESFHSFFMSGYWPPEWSRSIWSNRIVVSSASASVLMYERIFLRSGVCGSSPMVKQLPGASVSYSNGGERQE